MTFGDVISDENHEMDYSYITYITCVKNYFNAQ